MPRGRRALCGLRMLLSLSVLSVVCPRPLAAAPIIVSGEDASRLVTVTEVQVQNGKVSGVLVNNSHHPIRDVALVIDHVWLWSDERHPGEDSPGRTAYYTAHHEIPANASAPFTYEPVPPLPQRTDGHFETSVAVVGLVEVGASASGQVEQ